MYDIVIVNLKDSRNDLKKRFEGRQAGKKRLRGRQAKTQWQACIDSHAGKQSLKGGQPKTNKQASKH